jgi:glycosyltransferase involved in cell wall biosynthesis
LHVVHLDLERTWRGGQRQVFLLMGELVRHEIRQTLICREGSRFSEVLTGFSGVDTIAVPNRLAALRQRPRGDRVIYHAHSGNTVPLVVLASGDRPSVVTRRVDLPVHPWLFRRADAIVAISQRVEEVLLEAGIPAKRLHLIADGIDRRRALDEAVTAELRERVGAHGGRFVGLTVAAMVEGKDPFTLVRALPEVPAGYLHIWVGGGELEREMADLARELGVGDKLILTGWDPDPDKWFGVADALVQPSVFEGLGSIFLDAFQFNVPVVGADIPGTKDLLEEGVSALKFPAGDSSALAACIRRLIDEPGLRSDLVDEGARRVAAFDIRIVAQQYLHLYEELLDTS